MPKAPQTETPTTTDRPILFSGKMVQAILEGRKTQTRRIIKYRDPRWEVSDDALTGKIWPYWPDYVHGGELDDSNCICPYGQSGDRLWVRETWQYTGPELNDEPGYVYRATDPDWASMEGWKWKPSIFMPRQASRISLEIESVRVEKLQDISEEDAIAEGSEAAGQLTAVNRFTNLWVKINGEGSFDANPWVWVIEFRRV